MRAYPVVLDTEGLALSRYIEHWHPELHPRDARKKLEHSFATATFVTRDSSQALTFWRTDEGVILAVDEHGIVNTVMPRGTKFR